MSTHGHQWIVKLYEPHLQCNVSFLYQSWKDEFHLRYSATSEDSVTPQTLQSRKKDVVKATAALRRQIPLIKFVKLWRQWFASCSVGVRKLLLLWRKNTNWGYRWRKLCHRRSHRHHAKGPATQNAVCRSGLRSLSAAECYILSRLF